MGRTRYVWGMSPLHPLERYRVKAGLSQHDAAVLTGLNVKTLRNSEHGHTTPHIPSINKLARVYRVDPAVLLEEIRAYKEARAA